MNERGEPLSSERGTGRATRLRAGTGRASVSSAHRLRDTDPAMAALAQCLLQRWFRARRCRTGAATGDVRFGIGQRRKSGGRSRARAELSVGSGVTVAPSIVVTNCHVTRDAATIRISGGGSSVAGHRTIRRRSPRSLLSSRARLERPAGKLGGRDALRRGSRLPPSASRGGTGRTLRFGRVQALHSLDGASGHRIGHARSRPARAAAASSMRPERWSGC